MSYIEDLTSFNYFGVNGPRLLAVGWLDADHEYSKGCVTKEFFDSLGRLAQNAWQPFAVAGRHSCRFCVFTGGPQSIFAGGASVSIGSGNLFVPTPDLVYVAPLLILHYIDAHSYYPPEEFQQATARCPEMRSMAYLKAIRTHGLHKLRGDGNTEI